MSRLFPIMLAGCAMALAGPAAAQMHEGSRGGGGFHATGGGQNRASPGRGGDAGAHAAAASGDHGGASAAFQDRQGPYEFHGRTFTSLNPDERSHWQSGAWRHELHNGVFGWWWFLDDDWFFYPDAIYPYPTYIAPLLTVQETPEPPPAQAWWYHCANPQGYYPYVPACPTGWQTVPAAPADAPANAPPPPPAP